MFENGILGGGGVGWGGELGTGGLAYNPSYLESRDQEDLSLKPAQVNSSRNPIPKIPNTKG
jgi:hypothetical protein